MIRDMEPAANPPPGKGRTAMRVFLRKNKTPGTGPGVLFSYCDCDQRPLCCWATMQNSIGIDSIVLNRDVSMAMRAALALASAST